MPQEEFGTVGVVLAGVIGLIIALTRGWLLLPRDFDTFQSRLDEMREDRDFWRKQALDGQRQSDEALSIRYDEIQSSEQSDVE